MTRALLALAVLLVVGCATQKEVPPVTETPPPYVAPQLVLQDSEPEPWPVAPPVVYHTAQRADTLWALAVRYYGNGKLWKDIMAANAHVLKDPRFLKPGMELVIPPRDVAR